VANRRERWLHARISENLEEALKREARRRRSPVSLVVRNVLEGALDLVEGLVQNGLEGFDGLDAARRSERAARHARSRRAHDRADADDIYGWQELILNRPAHCARCRTELAVGAGAFRGLRDEPGGPLVFLCTYCVRRLRQTPDATKNRTTEVQS